MLHFPRRRPATIAVLLAIAVLAVNGCSKDKDKPEKSPDKPAEEGAPSKPAVVQFTVTGVDANATTPPDEATIAAVKKTLDGWAATAVVEPLRSGDPAGDLSPFFTAPALERLGDPAVRATLVDEGLPAATKSVEAEVANVSLASAAGESGVAVIAARFELKVHAVGDDSDIDVVHSGDLMLVPDADAWKIDSFSVRTARDSRE